MRITTTIGTGFDYAGNKISNTQQHDALQHVLAQASGLFGGVSAQYGLGGWLDGFGKLIVESNVTLTIFTDDSYDNREKAEQLAEISREAFKQTAVVLTFNDESPKFITQEQAPAVA